MNEIVQKENIEDMIYEIRGKQVMLDSDLARLYECSNGTKSINLAVKRHINRFPERFMFQLTVEEYKKLRFQIETTNNMSRSLPYVFTEQGVAMLASVLRPKIAEEVSIRIMDAFVVMKKYFSSTVSNNDILINHENRILKLEDIFYKFNKKEKVNKIFFEGELYDSYSVLLDIFNSYKEEIIIIDNYASKELFDVLRNIDRKIIVVSKNIDDVLKKKYEKQYDNIKFINNDSFHDRFIILDRNKLYTCGASFKDLGKKCFAINEFGDKKYLNCILEIISEVR